MKLATVLIVLPLIIMSAVSLTLQTHSGGGSGIEGVITVSPVQPGPVRPGVAASMPLANATFAVEQDNGEVTSFITNDQGQFRIPLAPGHYSVSIKGRKSTIGRFGPFEVDVVSGKMT